MFNKRYKRIEKKIDDLTRDVATMSNMLADIAAQLDARRSAGAAHKQALQTYMNSVTGIMTAQGAPPKFIDAFKDLLNQAQ